MPVLFVVFQNNQHVLSTSSTKNITMLLPVVGLQFAIIALISEENALLVQAAIQ